MREIRAGDWVRFYRDGRFVIAQVEYVTGDTHDINGLMACTHEGEVDVDVILEVRGKEKK